MEKYESFTKLINPSHWRSCGTHYSNLNELKNDISRYSEMTPEELEKSPQWVKDQL